MKLPKERMLKKFLWLMEERERIRLKRKAGEPYPWTVDYVMKTFRLCNVDREHDRVTVWIRENWRDPCANHENLWFSMCVARQFNWPETLSDIGFPETWNPGKTLKILEKRKRDGKKVFTSAYLLGGGNTFGLSKAEYIVKKVLDPVWKEFHKRPPLWTDFTCSLKGVFEWLLQFHGWGKFLAYEVVTDLRHTRYLRNAYDIQSWANIGPGAQRGLNRLYERELRRSHPQEQLLEELVLVKNWITERRDVNLLPHIEARTIEHTSCEYDKHQRAIERIKEGKTVGLERFRPPGLV